MTLFRVQDNCDSTQTDAAAAAQRVLLAALVPYLPSGVTLTCAPTVSIVAEADGSLAEQRSIATVPAVVTGSSAAAYSASSGACVVWRTNVSTGRRVLMGRTFFVPLTSATFDATGKLGTTPRNAILTAATTYVNRVSAGVPGHPAVWHRPVNFSGGQLGAVTSVSVNIVGADLRRRRD